MVEVCTCHFLSVCCSPRCVCHEPAVLCYIAGGAELGRQASSHGQLLLPTSCLPRWQRGGAPKGDGPRAGPQRRLPELLREGRRGPSSRPGWEGDREERVCTVAVSYGRRENSGKVRCDSCGPGCGPAAVLIIQSIGSGCGATKRGSLLLKQPASSPSLVAKLPRAPVLPCAGPGGRSGLSPVRACHRDLCARSPVGPRARREASPATSGWLIVLSAPGF